MASNSRAAPRVTALVVCGRETSTMESSTSIAPSCFAFVPVSTGASSDETRQVGHEQAGGVEHLARLLAGVGLLGLHDVVAPGHAHAAQLRRRRRIARPLRLLGRRLARRGLD